MLAFSHPVIATILIGIGMQQAGWMAHDYCHGRGDACRVIGTLFGGLYNGFSPRWWAHKHNTHHAFPNRLEIDSDIHNEPLLHLWFPKKGKDAWFRRYQHLYYPFVYAFLYFSWRMQSIQFVLASINWLERGLIILNYMWLAYLPWKVAVGAIILGGWLVAIVVTANHQTEDIMDTEDEYSYAEDQFKTTRGVVTSDPVSEYLFGGMQYQLEHHLFPIMPKYRYKKLRPIVKQWAEENNLPFKTSSIAGIMMLNYQTMKKYAQEFAPEASNKKTE